MAATIHKDASTMDTALRQATTTEKESVRTPHDVSQSGQQDVNMYPTGIRLFFLAGASIMGVFLISFEHPSLHMSCSHLGPI